jgi:hypothetical protein
MQVSAATYFEVFERVTIVVRRTAVCGSRAAAHKIRCKKGLQDLQVLGELFREAEVITGESSLYHIDAVLNVSMWKDYI